MRVVSKPLLAIGLALLATACGASPQPVIATPVSPWPEVVTPPDVLKPPPAPLSSKIQQLTDDDPRLYEVLVTIHHGFARTQVAYAQPDWSDALHQEEVINPKQFTGCTSGQCNQLILPVGVPTEAMRWLSLAGYHWRNSQRDSIQHQSLTGIGRQRRSTGDFSVIKQTLKFEPASEVQCTTRRKHFSDQTTAYVDPADHLVDAYQRQQGIDVRDWPVPKATNDKGHLFAKLSVTSERRYRLNIHWSAGVDMPQNGEALDWALVCESSRILKSDWLGHFAHEIVQTDEQFSVLTHYKPTPP